MKKTGLISTLSTFACVCLISGSANALLLDFTDSSLQLTTPSDTLGSIDATDESTIGIDYGSFSVSLTSFVGGDQGGDLTFNGTEGPGAINIGTQQFAGDGDGIGINDDEISFGQMLEVSFDPAITVNEIYFLDLFVNGNEQETAIITYNLNTFTWTTSVDGGILSTYGGVSIGSNTQNVLSIELSSDASVSDFSLAGVDVAPVPEPATMLLFGSGLVGLAGIYRKKKKC